MCMDNLLLFYVGVILDIENRKTKPTENIKITVLINFINYICIVIKTNSWVGWHLTIFGFSFVPGLQQKHSLRDELVDRISRRYSPILEQRKSIYYYGLCLRLTFRFYFQ